MSFFKGRFHFITVAMAALLGLAFIVEVAPNAYAGELIPRARKLQSGNTYGRMRLARRSTAAEKSLRRTRSSNKVESFSSTSPYDFRITAYEQARAKYEQKLQKWQVKVEKQQDKAEAKMRKDIERERTREEKRAEKAKKQAAKEKKKEEKAKERTEARSKRSFSLFGSSPQQKPEGQEAQQQQPTKAETYFQVGKSGEGSVDVGQSGEVIEPQAPAARPSLWQRLKRALFGS